MFSVSRPAGSSVTRLCCVLALVTGLVGCARPGAEPADTAARVPDSVQGNASSPSSSASPRIIGTCCPDSDSAIYALMERHERTPEAERTPEVALWPYRMNSGLTEAERIVVRDSASWAALWPRIVGTHSPRPRPPRVDFASEMVIVASMGVRSSGGYLVAIDSIVARDDTLRVLVREQSPGPRCGTTAALTEPVAIARIARSDLPVHFTTRNVVRDCP